MSELLTRTMLDMGALDRAAAQAADDGRWDDADRIWTEMRERDPKSRNALWGLGYSALQRGDAANARSLLFEAWRVAPEDRMVLLALAMACKDCNDIQGEGSALRTLLDLYPNDLSGLLANANLLERMGHPSSTQAYENALQAAPASPEQWPQQFRVQLERAKAITDRRRQALFKALSDKVTEFGGAMSAMQRERWMEGASILSGITPAYHSDPHKFLVPRLAATPFYDRSLFPWLEAFEAKADVMRQELTHALQVKNEGFVPYVALGEAAAKQWSTLNNSKDWSVLYLWQNGARNEENIALCPETAKALEQADQAYIHGNCPNAMFSALAPRTHIPPHCGESNARVVMHLPLVVPENCGHLRVGYEKREWKVGETLIFDDSIEHEAHNDSDELRVVLLFDAWHPDLTAPEREMVNALISTNANFR